VSWDRTSESTQWWRRRRHLRLTATRSNRHLDKMSGRAIDKFRTVKLYKWLYFRSSLLHDIFWSFMIVVHEALLYHCVSLLEMCRAHDYAHGNVFKCFSNVFQCLGLLLYLFIRMYISVLSADWRINVFICSVYEPLLQYTKNTDWVNITLRYDEMF